MAGPAELNFTLTLRDPDKLLEQLQVAKAESKRLAGQTRRTIRALAELEAQLHGIDVVHEPDHSPGGTGT